MPIGFVINVEFCIPLMVVTGCYRHHLYMYTTRLTVADGYWCPQPMMPASKGSLCSEPHALLENQGSLDTYRSGASTKVNELLVTVLMLRYALTHCRMRTCLGSLTIGGTSDISPVRTPGHAALRSPGSPWLPLGKSAVAPGSRQLCRTASSRRWIRHTSSSRHTRYG